MNKKTITLISIITLLASLQLACSFSDMLGNLGQENGQPVSQSNSLQRSHPSQDGDEEQDPAQDELEQENPNPTATPSGCVNSFTGSSNIPDGSEYQAGDAVETSLTLTNTGTCSWNSAYSLSVVGGDLIPSSEDLPVVALVAPGESIMVGVEFSAPAQDGVYLSAWKMVNGDGDIFGMDIPQDAPLRIKIRVISSGNPQPTPNPTQSPQASGDQFTMLAGECFDYNSDAVADCNGNSVDFKYTPTHPLGELLRNNDNTFGENHTSKPDLSTCETDSYITLPHEIQENEYLCFKIETLASTTYGWMRITNYNDDGMTFDFEILGSGSPLATAVPNTTLFVESQGEQITLLEGQCYDVWNGEKNSSCSGIFAGFLFEEVTKKSLQVSQISPNEMYISAAMTSKPTKSDCMSASYSTTSIWPIQATSYYCYQFVPGTGTYYGWLRPTSFNLSGLTFDYLTWETSQ